MISPTSVTKNDINANTMEHRGQVHSHRTLEGAISFNGDSRTCGREVSMNTRGNGQSVRSGTEGNVNPSFSSGSIGCHLLTGSDDEPTKRQSGSLNTINKTQTGPGNLPRHFTRQGSVDTDSENVQYKSGHKNSRKKNLGARSFDRSSTHCPARDRREGRTTPQTAVRQNSLPASLRDENNSNRLRQQVKREELVNRNCHQTIDVETGIACGPSLEISYFGLSKSDVSLSSVTNQGNEFFGQKEYQHPVESCDVFEASCSGAFSSGECNNNVDALSNGEVTGANRLRQDNPNTGTAQDCVHKSSTASSRSENDSLNRQIDKLSFEVCLADMQSVNPITNSSACAIPSDFNHGVIGKESAKEETLPPSVSISDSPQVSESITPTLSSSGNVSSSQPLPPRVTGDLTNVTSGSHDAMSHDEGSHDTVSCDAALPSHDSQLQSEKCQSLIQDDNEIAANKTLFPFDESGSCEKQTLLPSNSHDTRALLPSTYGHLASTRTCQASSELSEEWVPQSQNHVPCTETPLPSPGNKQKQQSPNHKQKEPKGSLSDVYQELDRQPGQIIDDFSRNDTSLLEANTRCRANNTLSSDPDGSPIVSNELCSQLLPLQAHT